MCSVGLVPRWGESGGGVRGYQNRYWCVGSQGRDMTAREPPWERNRLPPMANIMQIASTKSRSMRGASHQPGFIVVSSWWWMG